MEKVDDRRLKARMVICGENTVSLAEKLGITSASIGKKLNGENAMWAKEVFGIAEILGLDERHVNDIFFDGKLKKRTTE